MTAKRLARGRARGRHPDPSGNPLLHVGVREEQGIRPRFDLLLFNEKLNAVVVVKYLDQDG